VLGVSQLKLPGYDGQSCRGIILEGSPQRRSQSGHESPEDLAREFVFTDANKTMGSVVGIVDFAVKRDDEHTFLKRVKNLLKQPTFAREALDEMADNLAAQAGPPHHVEGVGKTSKSPGCNFSGFLLVKKVPGTMHFGARAPGHSVDHLNMNMSHFVHHFYYGTLPSPRRRRALAALHPLGLSDDWADKLRGRSFMSPSAGATYEHSAQVRWGGAADRPGTVSGIHFFVFCGV
jgi:hypothetical protein